MDDKELMEQVKTGDEEAFAQIVSAYKNRVVNFLWQLMGNYEKAVEISQETFMRVYFKADKYQPIAPLSSWIYTIAANLAKTELKKSSRLPQVPMEAVENFLAEGSAVSHDSARKDMIKKVRQAIDALPPRYRIPVVLKDIEGFSQEEIAQMMKRPIGTIKARISRGRSQLKRELERSVFASDSLAVNEE